jgi:transcriptional repressor NrdR
MKCPFCGRTASKVVDSRTAEGGIRRRRLCQHCEQRFSTFEQVQRRTVMVVKKDGRREEFQREKLLTGLRISARKRPLPTGAIDAIVDDIEQRLTGSTQSEVASRVIGEMAISRLKPLDPIAYIRFASVYHQFVSLEEMLDELQRLAVSPDPPGPEQQRLFADELAAVMDEAQLDQAEAADEHSTGDSDEVKVSPTGSPISLDAARAARPL